MRQQPSARLDAFITAVRLNGVPQADEAVVGFPPDITYDAQATTAQGDSVRVESAEPFETRPAPDAFKIVAAKVDSPCQIEFFRGERRLIGVREGLQIEECPEGG